MEQGITSVVGAEIAPVATVEGPFTVDELERQFAELPSTQKREWSKEENDYLMKYWHSKNHRAMAQLLKISESALKIQHRRLCREGSCV